MFSPRHNDNNKHPQLNFPLSTHIDRMEHIAIICICILPIISYNMQHINQIVLKKVIKCMTHFPLNCSSIVIHPLQTIHVNIQHLGQGVTVHHHVPPPLTCPAVLGLGRRVQVGDDLLQVLAHPGQLPVQVFS